MCVHRLLVENRYRRFVPDLDGLSSMLLGTLRVPLGAFGPVVPTSRDYLLNEGGLSAIKPPIVDRARDLTWIDFSKACAGCKTLALSAG